MRFDEGNEQIRYYLEDTVVLTVAIESRQTFDSIDVNSVSFEQIAQVPNASVQATFWDFVDTFCSKFSVFPWFSDNS